MEQIILENKYNISFTKEVFEKDIIRLTNQLWKLIPMRENGENWEKQLKTVQLEIIGLGNIFYNRLSFLSLVSKLEGLLTEETSFELYRKTIFETINLLQELKK